MIEVFFVLTTWCDPSYLECLIESKITEGQISTWEICETIAESVPADIMDSVPGLLAIGRCERRKVEKPKEEK